MTMLTQAELKDLVASSEIPSISIFLPTHHAGAEIQQNPIRLKNLLRQTEERLLGGEMRQADITRLLAPAHQLIDDTLFWHYQSDGLALFISASAFRYYRLPLEFQEEVIVNNCFQIRHLLPLFTGDGNFYLLALSRDEVRLFKGSRYSMNQIDLKDMPHSLAEALKYDDFQKEGEFRGSTTQARANRAALHQAHGVGYGDNVDQPHDELLRYFREVDRGLHEMLQGNNAPLLLAGVEYLFPIYRMANTYPHLMPEGVTGNPELLSADDLHRKGWNLVEPKFKMPLNDAVAQYNNLAGTGKTSDQISEITPAACTGRVGSLFVANNGHLWGSYREEEQLVELYEHTEKNAEDLLDLATTQTIRNGGSVFAIPPESIPGGASVAAIYRY